MIYLLLILPGAGLTLFLHELSHVLVIQWHDYLVYDFKPWPHCSKILDRFVLGEVVYSGDLPDEVQRQCSLAPAIKAICLLACWLFLGYFYLPCIILAGWELLDLIKWLLEYFYGATDSCFDGARYRRLN